jgi:hypothetical protein
MVLAGSAVVGQVLGGLLVSADLFGLSWRPIFLVNVPVGIALLAVAARVLPADAANGTQRLDLGGVAALSGALLLVLLPLTLGRDAGWPLWTWCSLAASVPALAAFTALQRRRVARGDEPLVNLGLLTRPAVGWGLGSLGLLAGVYFAVLFVLALYLQQGLGHSAAYSGCALVSWVAAFGVTGPLLDRMPGAAARTPRRRKLARRRTPESAHGPPIGPGSRTYAASSA